MTPQPVTVAPNDTVSSALGLLLKHRQLGLPVVSADGVYLGMFLRSVLLARLLPGITKIEGAYDNVSRIVEAMAAGESAETLTQRFRAIAGDPVKDFLDTAGPVVNPDTPAHDPCVAPGANDLAGCGQGHGQACRRHLRLGPAVPRVRAILIPKKGEVPSWKGTQRLRV